MKAEQAFNAVDMNNYIYDSTWFHL